jgi:hypothetical protein
MGQWVSTSEMATKRYMRPASGTRGAAVCEAPDMQSVTCCGDGLSDPAPCGASERQLFCRT